MKFKDYIETLQAKINADPTLLELDVCYATDDECNSFSKNVFEPDVIYMIDGESIFKDDITNGEYEDTDIETVFCIN